MRVWIRFDPTGNEEVIAEDEAGNEVPLDITAEWDGGFHLIGPLDLQEGEP